MERYLNLVFIYRVLKSILNISVEKRYKLGAQIEMVEYYQP
jgi:hypothetical protein